MFRNLTCLGIKHIKKSVTTKRLEKCLCSKHIFYSVHVLLMQIHSISNVLLIHMNIKCMVFFIQVFHFAKKTQKQLYVTFSKTYSYMYKQLLYIRRCMIILPCNNPSHHFRTAHVHSVSSHPHLPKQIHSHSHSHSLK